MCAAHFALLGCTFQMTPKRYAMKFTIVQIAAVLSHFAMTSHACMDMASSQTVSKSWQSSSYEHPNGHRFCGLDRALNTLTSFHTAVGTQSADDGYHWFVMNLTQPLVLIALEVGVGGYLQGEDLWRSSETDAITSRADGIEVWITSQMIDFGRQLCNSRDIGSTFNRTRGSWNNCGRTQPRSQTEDGFMKANCLDRHVAQMVLLRKHVADINDTNRQCMSFAFVNFSRPATLNITIEPPGLVRLNSSVTVRCDSLSCPEDWEKVSLCRANSHPCLARGNLSYHMASAQPSDSDNYTCSVDGEVISFNNLRVLYPPETLKISVAQRNCTQAPSHVTFAFESSAADPVPDHLCTATNSSGNQVMMMRQSVASQRADDGRSLWVCQNCSGSGNLTVHCAAVQICPSDKASLCNSSAAVLWNSTEIMEWNCATPLEAPEPDKTPQSAMSRSALYIALPVAGIAAVALGFAIFKLVVRRSNQQQPAASVSVESTPPKLTPPQPCVPEIPLKDVSGGCVNLSPDSGANEANETVMANNSRSTCNHQLPPMSRPASEFPVCLEISRNGAD